MTPSRHRPTTAAAIAIATAVLLAAPAHARLDWARDGGMPAPDSAALRRGAAPLTVPDRFGPGAVLSVSAVRMKVVNDGTLGNPYLNTSSDPSAQWPGSSGVEYLNAIALAVAAVNPATDDANARRRVSFFQEWRPPTRDPVDRIYSTFDGDVRGRRYENDDGDLIPNDPDHLPRIDEDFLDGHDDDGDGLIDEDHAAFGQQEYSYVIRDDTPEAVNTVFNEKHVPLGLEAKVRVWAYALPGYENFNVARYDIVNVSGHELDSLAIGWLVDMDAGPVHRAPFWTDDLDFPRYPQGSFVYRVGSQPGDLPDPLRRQGGAGQSHGFAYYYPSARPIPADTALCPRVTVRIAGFSVADDDGDDGETSGIGTFMLIDHTTDPTGRNAPRRVGFRSFRSSHRNVEYSQGGPPRTDLERFQMMESGENIGPTGQIDATPGGSAGDYLEWCSVGPFRNVQPGQSVSVTVAFGVSTGTAALAAAYAGDLNRLANGLLTGADLIARYPAVANALTAQVAFEGIHEYRTGTLETKPVAQGGRDGHGRETALRLPAGSPDQLILQTCGMVQREIVLTDHDWNWIDSDCDYCTGVWVDSVAGLPSHTGLYQKHWNTPAPPPNPATNVASAYDFSDNPGRRVAPSADKAVRLAWDNLPEVTPDPVTRWLDFRGVDVWKAADWTRPPGSPGPAESDWLLLGEFRVFDYFRGANPGDPPLERNYTRDPATGDKVCPMRFIPDLYDPATGLRGKSVPVCLDRFDLWDKESGRIVRPDWTVPCEYDTAHAPATLELASGDLEWNVPARTGGSYAHAFRDAGTYPYVCLRHLAHHGTVVVADAGADSASVDVLDTGFAPPSVTVRPGGVVRWVNRGAVNHALQSDRHCLTTSGVIVHRILKENPGNFDARARYPVGRYALVDEDVHNGFTYFYSVTAFDSTTDQSVTTQLGGRRYAAEADAVVPQAAADANGRRGAWVVPNPYRGYASIPARPSAWDLSPNASDPTGTHIDFMGLPRGRWTIRIWTVAGDLVQELHSSDAVNEFVRRPVTVGGVTLPGYNRQQDAPDDGQARWNLISRSGQDVASGIYLFTVESAEGMQRGRFVIIR